MKYEHNDSVEERYFALDIEALGDYDPGFKTAWENGSQAYEMKMELKDAFQLLPRKIRKIKQYERLVRFLGSKGITLEIVSQKTKTQVLK